MAKFYAIYPPIGGSVLPPGAATAANQVLEINQLTGIHSDTTSIDSKTVHVDTGNVTIVASALPTGAATLAEQQTQTTQLTGIHSDTTSLDGKTVIVDTDNVTVVASALPTGAATEAKQDAQIVQETAIAASVASIDTKLTNPLPVSGPLTDTQLRASPVPVSAASLPLPTGAATAANQATEIASLASIDTKLTSPLAVTGPLTDTELRANPVPVSGTVSTGSLTDAELRASPVPVSLTSTTITGSVAVTGPLTDTQLRATPVPVSGTVSTGGLTDVQLRASAVPVSLTSTTITGSVAVTAASLPLPTGAATEATLAAFSTKSAAGFVPEAFDETVITYVGATTRIDTVVYKLAAATVATLTLSYDGSDRLDGVVKT